MTTLVILSTGLLSSCGVERTQPLDSAPKVTMGQTANASSRAIDTSTAILGAAASGKLTGYMGPADNVAPNLFLQSLGETCTMANGNMKYSISLYGYLSAPSGVTISVACH